MNTNIRANLVEGTQKMPCDSYRTKIPGTAAAVLLLACLFSRSYGVGTTSDSSRTFPERSSVSNSVDLLSGNVQFALPLWGLRDSVGPTVDLTLRYSSNVERQVRADNKTSPTGVIGLGWAMGFGSIRCEHGGTVALEDDRYFWVSPEGVSQEIVTSKAPGRTTGFAYWLEKNPYWVVLAEDPDGDGMINGWTLVDPSGRRYTYGLSDESFATRYVLCWPSMGYVV